MGGRSSQLENQSAVIETSRQTLRWQPLKKRLESFDQLHRIGKKKNPSFNQNECIFSSFQVAVQLTSPFKSSNFQVRVAKWRDIFRFALWHGTLAWAFSIKNCEFPSETWKAALAMKSKFRGSAFPETWSSKDRQTISNKSAIPSKGRPFGSWNHNSYPVFATRFCFSLWPQHGHFLDSLES